MSFFVGKNVPSVAEELMQPEMLMKVAPEYYGPSFAALADLRQADDGTGHKGQEFRRVASFKNLPLLDAQKLTEPNFLSDKRVFYSFLDRNNRYCTYQRRGRAGRADLARQNMPLSVLGIDYPAAVEEFVPVEIPSSPEDAEQ